MACKRVTGASLRLLQGSSASVVGDPLMRYLTPALARSMATEASTSEIASISGAGASNDLFSLPPSSEPVFMNPGFRRPSPPVPKVITTVHSFPTMEPLRFEHYPANQLYLPLRRDLLHRAVIYEGDATRQGTASTKWRSEVRGSGRKIRPQKGTGQARLGDKKSPMLRGGGVAHGPHPRDFSTGLNRKMYDLAWRTALSYRYRRGQLLVIEDGAELEIAEPRWFTKVMAGNQFGNAYGRSLIVTSDVRPNLWSAVAGAGHHGKVRTQEEVDVKNMLELGRIIIEKSALDFLLAKHSSDLNRTVPSAVE